MNGRKGEKRFLLRRSVSSKSFVQFKQEFESVNRLADAKVLFCKKWECISQCTKLLSIEDVISAKQKIEIHEIDELITAT